MSRDISVAIPVYNAARYVTLAVTSALQQPETAEVILVEDGSADNSLEVCQALAGEEKRVRLYRHPGGENRGAATSRNLGMEKSASNLIAFLDADDFYLPGRFSTAVSILEAHPECDGVYETLGIQFDSEPARQRWAAAHKSMNMTGVDREVLPQDLFRTLVEGRSGHIHLNTLVIRRRILEKSGEMDVSLVSMHEDIDFVWRLAAVGRLLPGRLTEPVAVRRVHEENRISAPRSPERIFRERMKAWMATYRWCRRNHLREQQELVFERMLAACIGTKPCQPHWIESMPPALRKAWRFVSWPIDYPEVLLEPGYWKKLFSPALIFLKGRPEG